MTASVEYAAGQLPFFTSARYEVVDVTFEYVNEVEVLVMLSSTFA